MIAGLISGMFGPLVRWAQRKQELAAQAEANRSKIELEALKNQGVAEEYEAKSAMSRLKAFPEWFRTAVVSMFLYPFVMIQFSKEHALTVINNMAALPTGYNEGVFIIVCAMAGIPVGARMVSTVFDSVTGYLQGKRNALYDHEQAVARINRQAVMDSFRADLGGKLSQKTVDMINKAINAGDDDPSNDGTVRGE